MATIYTCCSQDCQWVPSCSIVLRHFLHLSKTSRDERSKDRTGTLGSKDSEILLIVGCLWNKSTMLVYVRRAELGGL